MVLTVTTVILIMVMDLQNTFKIISYLPFCYGRELVYSKFPVRK